LKLSKDKSLSNRYNTLTTNDHFIGREAIDTPMYARHIQLRQSLNSENKKEFHSSQVFKRQIKKIVLSTVVASLIAPFGASTALAAPYSVDHLKLYAHSRILNYKEFMCFNAIITKESRWSYKASNGSHYGLGQMKSKHYRDLDPYRQIDATLRYITKRYNTNCKAWLFHQQRNYF
jgi:hypothetical protein